MSNASIGRHDWQPSESVVSSNAIEDSDMLANVGHGSIFDVVPHLGQPVINDSELFQGPLLDASTMNVPELDFFLKCGLPDKQASPVAAGASLGPQFDLASTVTWANMGLDMPSATQNEFTGGTSPMETVRYMSSSSSQSSLMPDRDSSSSSECSMATNTASFCCEGLRLLLRVFAGQEKEEHVIILPGYETVRPVMDMFAKLERFSQQRQHDRRAAILRRASITPLTASGVRDMIPSKVRCDVLVEAYSRTFESVMRILDVPVFLREYNDFWEKPAAKLTTKDEPFACKLLLVVALASCVCLGVGSPTEGESAQQEVSAGWIIQVKQWLEQNMLTGVQSQVDMAQILCLLALTRNIQHHPGASASSALCLGYYDPTHIGIRMGLHRESPTRGIAPADPRTTELRRRLWATMLELSLQICLDEGLPPPLAPDAYNCEPPSSLADEGIGRSSSQSDSTRSIVLIKLSGTQRLRLRILQLLNNPGADYTFEESHQLAGELSAACNSDLNTLHSLQSQQPQLSDFQVKTLDTLTRPFVLALHGRFATRACSTPAFYFSRQMRMETAVRLLSHPLRRQPCGVQQPAAYLSAAQRPDHLAAAQVSAPPAYLDDAYSILRIHGHTHFSTVPRQATAALFLDLVSELEENLFPTLHSSSRQHIRDVLDSSVRIFESRMRAAGGTHSAREFVLFSAASAYVDALTRRGGDTKKIDVDEAVARAACSALEICAEVVGLMGMKA